MQKRTFEIGHITPGTSLLSFLGILLYLGLQSSNAWAGFPKEQLAGPLIGFGLVVGLITVGLLALINVRTLEALDAIAHWLIFSLTCLLGAAAILEALPWVAALFAGAGILLPAHVVRRNLLDLRKVAQTKK